MKLDSNRAWKEASRNVSRNREALLAVAGVFFLLPQLVLALFYPEPEPTAGMSQQQIVALVQNYYLSTLPALLPLIFCQALGTLALLTLLNHAARPTVGGALRMGLSGVLSYLSAQILLGLAMALVGTTVLTGLAVSGVAALAVAGLILLLFVAVFVGVRLSLSGAVVAIEGERNPVRVLRRSWLLTRDNGGRLLAFYGLFIVAFLVIQIIVSLIVGIPLTMLASGATVQLAAAVLSSVLNALMALYLVAIVGAVHAQLAGRSPEEEQRPFA